MIKLKVSESENGEEWEGRDEVTIVSIL